MKRWMPILILLMMLGGCAKPAGVIFPPMETPLVWPPEIGRAHV